MDLCTKMVVPTWHTIKRSIEEFEAKTNVIEIPHAYTCKDRFCFHCNSIMKAHYRTLGYQETLADHISSGKIDLENLRLMMVTISPKNVPLGDLRNTVKALNAHIHRLLQSTKKLKYRFAPQAIWGFIRGTEVLGDSFETQLGIGMTHPHIHLLFAVDWDYYTSIIPPKPSKAKRPRKSKNPKKPKSRYLTQQDLSKMVAEEFARGITIDHDYNIVLDPLNPVKTPKFMQLEGCNVDMRIVFDGRKFANRYKNRTQERMQANLHAAMREVVKGMKFSSTDENIQPDLQFAQDFYDEIKTNAKDVLVYPDKGALSPEMLRRITEIDRKNAKEYEETGKSYAPLFIQLAEQMRGLRSFGSGGIFAKCKLTTTNCVDEPPHKASIFEASDEAYHAPSPRGEDKKKPLGQYLQEQGACELREVKTYNQVVGNECQILQDAYGFELSDFVKGFIDKRINLLSQEERSQTQRIYKAVSKGIRDLKEYLNEKQMDIRNLSEWSKEYPYQFNVWHLLRGGTYSESVAPMR
ncbi:protein rep [Helicobacter sp. L8]|uniref:protein rep n=1 Tax=Helicobacter sp. L8 TaxID=2316078 RepID=UPI0013CDE705|nr:protein rep [Helicobacter sp. L8]